MNIFISSSCLLPQIFVVCTVIWSALLVLYHLINKTLYFVFLSCKNSLQIKSQEGNKKNYKYFCIVVNDMLHLPTKNYEVKEYKTQIAKCKERSDEDLAICGGSPHHRRIIFQNSIRTAIFKTALWYIIWLFVISFKLISAVCKAVHAHFAVKPFLVKPVLPLDLAVIVQLSMMGDNFNSISSPFSRML